MFSTLFGELSAIFIKFETWSVITICDFIDWLIHASNFIAVSQGPEMFKMAWFTGQNGTHLDTDVDTVVTESVEL